MLNGTNMMEQNLFEDCENLIKKDLETWKSYFSKWEVFAKYEESVPESELLNGPLGRIKTGKRKKINKSSCKKKIKTVSSLASQRVSKIHQKRLCKMPKISSKVIKKCNNFKPDCVVKDPMNDQMEIILKSVVLRFLKTDRNNSEMFAVLSQTYSDRNRTDSSQLFTQCQQALFYKNLQSNESSLIIKQHILPSTTTKSIPSINICERSICPNRETYIQSLRKDFNFFDCNSKSVIDNNILNRTGNLFLNTTFPKFEFNYKSHENPHHSLMSLPNNTTSQQIIQRNFDIKTHYPAFCGSPNNKYSKLNLLKLDLSHESPTNVFRKINKEYFIKKAFPAEMNITQDRERFKNLCLHERTNSVSLSMGNSNFITPERKPSERKCFSENILQRKRRDPSKLFFDNEKKDSESDDQTRNRVSHINFKNKFKSQVIQKIMDSESDSDDSESIFDRVKKS